MGKSWWMARLFLPLLLCLITPMFSIVVCISSYPANPDRPRLRRSGLDANVVHEQGHIL